MGGVAVLSPGSRHVYVARIERWMIQRATANDLKRRQNGTSRHSYIVGSSLSFFGVLWAQDALRDFYLAVTWPCSFLTLRHVKRNSFIIIIIIIIIIISVEHEINCRLPRTLKVSSLARFTYGQETCIQDINTMRSRLVRSSKSAPSDRLVIDIAR